MIYLIGIVALVILALFNTVVVSNMWTWFFTPVFNVPTPQMHYIYGIMLMIGFMFNFGKESTGKTAAYQIFEHFIRGLVFLLLAWLVHVVFE